MPRLVSAEVDSADVLFEEYRTLQQETRDAITRAQGVVQYALATLGVGAGLGLAAASRSVAAAAVVLMGLIPILIVFALAQIEIEMQRVVTARRHLRQLERRINSAVARDTPSPLLTWEAARTLQQSRLLINPYRVRIVLAILAVILIGPVIGGVLLAENGRWVGFSIAMGLDLFFVAVAAPVFLRAYRRLGDLDVDETLSESPCSLPSRGTARPVG
jgi:hypothetical protein